MQYLSSSTIFREPVNLAFDAVQAFLTRSLDVVHHEPYVPPHGYIPQEME